MSRLVDHARTELERCGQWAEDPAYSQSIVAAVAVFASFGHSGGSAPMAVDQLTRLLNFENLAPITDDPDEWQDQSVISGTPMWQNIRNSKAISYDAGRTYFLVDEHRDGDPPTWHTSVAAEVGGAVVGGLVVPAEVAAGGYSPDGYMTVATVQEPGQAPADKEDQC